MALTPTAQQQDFLDALVDTTSNLALVARAGCGKTSTILMGVDALVKAHPNAEIVVCAYNKAIADEVKEKLIAAGHTDWRRVSAATLHSMGFGLLKFLFKPTIDDKKVRKLVEASNSFACQAYGEQVAKLVGYAKQAGVGFFPDAPIGNAQVWHDLADHFDVNGLDDTSEADAMVEAAQSIYKQSLSQTDVIDFDDMVLFPLVKNLRVRFQKDVLLLDEAQDLSRARQALARKFVKPHTGRMIVIGDGRQAIYGFSGSDAAALENLISSLNAVRMPLSVTWRCPKKVVALAQTIVPDIEAADSASEGSIEYVRCLPDDAKTVAETGLELVNPDDFIMCRNTAPLIGVAYKLIRKGIACKVEGRAIGDGLQALAKRWKVKTIDVLRGKLKMYRGREIEKAQAKGQDAKIEEIEDKVATLEGICEECTLQGKHTVADVCAFIDALFADGAKGVVTCMTYHRAKGRESKRVFLWEHEARCPSKMAKQPWQLEQEANLAYVAFTRPKEQLVFVN